MSKALISAARDQGLAMRGMAHDGDRTVLLFGPDEPDFWGKFTTAPEYHDRAPDPLDRWSKRILGTLAVDRGAGSLSVRRPALSAVSIMGAGLWSGVVFAHWAAGPCTGRVVHQLPRRDYPA